VTFIGHAGKSYTAGPSWWLVCVVVFTTMVMLSWFVVAPPFVAQARYYGAITIPHFLGRR
jgi:Na+/pantothenate symporter